MAKARQTLKESLEKKMNESESLKKEKIRANQVKKESGKSRKKFEKKNTLRGDDDTWEPEKNIDCPPLIDPQRLRKRKTVAMEPLNKKEDISKCKQPPTIKDDKKSPPTRENKNKVEPAECNKDTVVNSDFEGFEHGVKPEKIIGATRNVAGEIMLLMKWKGTEETELVPAKLAHEKCPQLVIQYYEQRISFDWDTEK